MINMMQHKLSYILAELTALQETYKQEIKDHPKCNGSYLVDELNTASECFKDALFIIANAEHPHDDEGDTLPEHHAMESRASRYI